MKYNCLKSNNRGQSRILPMAVSACLMVTPVVMFLGLLLGGCAQPAPVSTQKDLKSEPAISMMVSELYQQNKLDDRVADGQYVVAKFSLNNNTNKTMVVNPGDLMLQNKTTQEAERYTQPAEKGFTTPFNKVFEEAYKNKLLDFTPINLYPRLKLERFIIFMLPLDADVSGYEIIHVPTKTSVPLSISGTTLIHDNRETH